MYKIIGADQQEYGPVSADELRQWIAEGRANGLSRAQAEGSAEWRALESFPEFAAALSAVPAMSPGLSYLPARRSNQKTNGMAIAGFVCAIVSLPCCMFALPSVVGLIFSVIGLVQIRRHPMQRGKSLAIAGMLISLLTLMLWIAGLILFFTGMAQGADQWFSDET